MFGGIDSEDDTSPGASFRRGAEGKVIDYACGKSKLTYWALLTILGDTPWVAAQLSRKEAVGPTTKRICIMCDATSENKTQYFGFSDPGCPWKKLTTELLQAQHAQLDEALRRGTKTAWAQASKDTGLNSKETAFDLIPFCNYLKASTYDITHDEPEGPGRGHLYLMIHHALYNWGITMDEFNELVGMYPFLHSDDTHNFRCMCGNALAMSHHRLVGPSVAGCFLEDLPKVWDLSSS